MRTLSRALRRWDMLRIAAVTLLVAWVVVLGSFLFGESSTTFTPGAGAAAAAALAIALAGFLYAWREPAPLDR